MNYGFTDDWFNGLGIGYRTLAQGTDWKDSMSKLGLSPAQACIRLAEVKNGGYGDINM